MQTVLEVRDLSIGYPNITLCEGLSFDVEAGTTLAVLGANGAGKSTFVKMMLGLLPPRSGSMHWVSGKPKEIGYLAQMSDFDSLFPIRVRDLAAMGAWSGLGLRRRLDAEGKKRVAAALDEAGVLNIADQPIHTLSGGQLQRTLFARVILQDSPLIVLDEPFAAVDQQTEAHLLSIIGRWRSEGRAVVLVVHDLSSVLDHCTHALLLGNGTGTHGRVTDVITPDNLVRQNYMSASQADWMFRRSAPENSAEGNSHV